MGTILSTQTPVSAKKVGQLLELLIQLLILKARVRNSSVNLTNNVKIYLGYLAQLVLRKDGIVHVGFPICHMIMVGLDAKTLCILFRMNLLIQFTK